MESLDKLRELAADINSTEIIDHLDVIGKFMFHTDWLDSWHSEFDRLCDEIEREIAECYMLLPVDADGVPIRVGDKLILDNGYHPPMEVEVQPLTTYDSSCYRHVKPRTIEDVLMEFADKCCVHTRDELNLIPELVDEYADELRGMMEGE